MNFSVTENWARFDITTGAPGSCPVLGIANTAVHADLEIGTPIDPQTIEQDAPDFAVTENSRCFGRRRR